MKTPRWLAVVLCLVVLGSVGAAASLTLNWTDLSDNELGFRVERAIGESGEFVLLAEVGADVETYVDEMVSPSLIHRYRVAAYNSAGNSEYSNEASAVAEPPEERPDGPGPSLELTFPVQDGLINFSGRGQVGIEGNIHIGGFVIPAGNPQTVLIRAVGPRLGDPPFNVPGVLADPQLTLFRGQEQIGFNDNWGGDVAIDEARQAVSAFGLPQESLDAALLVTLDPGSYTVHMAGVDGATGVGLLEMYKVP